MPTPSTVGAGNLFRPVTRRASSNDARKIMVIELALIAERLQVRLPYRRGEGNDHRMWSEFLDSLTADGRKCLQRKTGADYPCYTAGLEELDAARRLLVSWAIAARTHPTWCARRRRN